MKLVSIITPSFNQASFLERTLKSVLDQDYSNIEYIVIDGASTDGSVDIIRKYADNLAFWVSEKDTGQAEAVNKGVERAKGEIVAWLNSDDCYLPGSISAAVEALEANPEAVMVYGDMLSIDENDYVINEFKYNQLTLRDLLCFQIIGQPAVFFRREAFEKAGGLDPSYSLLLDHQLWIRMANLGKIIHIPHTWSAARYHAQAKNRIKASEFGHEAFNILEWASADEMLAPILASVSRRARASAYRVDARYLLDGEQPLASLKAWTQALVIHPPTALARLNILSSDLLALAGLHRVRAWVLERRKRGG
jgi:glycosyltransferase involved in cell wall biosynthesis